MLHGGTGGADGWKAELVERGEARCTTTGSDDLVIVVARLQQLAAEAGRRIRVFHGGGDPAPMTHSMVTDTPEGRVHIDQRTGQPARFHGFGQRDPGPAEFYQERGVQAPVPGGLTMGADNWDHCPYCVDNAKSEHEAALQRLADAYGNVPVDTFNAMQKETPTEFDLEGVERTFREDYEIGLWGDDRTEVKVHYSGTCTVCGASATVKTTKLVDIKAHQRRHLPPLGSTTGVGVNRVIHTQ